ncbi:hypothetical protein GC194_00730 [bacterium]|nr:hypothetical protein [bacterium]
MYMHKKMRIYHRYLGFFLVGIMAMYALSGIVLIFRDSNVFKKEVQKTQTLPQGTSLEELGRALRIRDLKIEKTEGDMVYFEQGVYNTTTGEATYTQYELPFVLEKMTHLHKTSSDKPLAFLNIFFGVSLLFFVVSSFWMYLPKTDIFKKGLYFVAAGVVLTLLLLFV